MTTRTPLVPNADGAVADARQRSARIMQAVFACLSLAMLVVGLAINWFADRAGLSRETIDIAAFGMLMAAVAHATALWLWRS